MQVLDESEMIASTRATSMAVKDLIADRRWCSLPDDSPRAEVMRYVCTCTRACDTLYMHLGFGSPSYLIRFPARGLPLSSAARGHQLPAWVLRPCFRGAEKPVVSSRDPARWRPSRHRQGYAPCLYNSTPFRMSSG